jgi:hypothetical protein
VGQKQKQWCQVCGKNHKAKTKCKSLNGAKQEAARIAKKAMKSRMRG